MGGHAFGSMLLVDLARMQQKMKIKSLQTACAGNMKQTAETGRVDEVSKQTNKEFMAHWGSQELCRVSKGM